MAITKITKLTEIEQWHFAKDNIIYPPKKSSSSKFVMKN